MAYFNLKSDFALFVQKTATGVKVDGQEHMIDGDKVMERGLHIYTVCFEHKTIVIGDDYYAWRMGAVSFNIWSQNINKPMEEWDYEETPDKLLINGTVYDVEGADSSWPLPSLRLDGELVGYIDSETDMVTGATERKVKWVSAVVDF